MGSIHIILFYIILNLKNIRKLRQMRVRRGTDAQIQQLIKIKYK